MEANNRKKSKKLKKSNKQTITIKRYHKLRNMHLQTTPISSYYIHSVLNTVINTLSSFYTKESTDLSYQELYDCPSLNDNTNILNLQGNYIETIRLYPLNNLIHLDLSYNKLMDFPCYDPIFNSFHEILPIIEYMDLSFNYIRSLPNDIGSLISLKQLKLNNNILEILPNSIGDLTSLNVLLLNNNRLKELPKQITSLVNLKNNDLNSFNINDNKELINPIRETAERGITAIRNYFKEVANQDNTINHIKLILLGPLGSGKATLRNHLLNDENIYGKNPWYINNKRIEFNIIDFTNLTTHEIFFSAHALYFITWDMTLALEHHIDNNIQYWIDFIQLTYPGSNIFVIGTHADKISNVDWISNDIDSNIKMCNDLSNNVMKKLIYNEKLRENQLNNRLNMNSDNVYLKNRIEKLLKFRPKIYDSIIYLDLSNDSIELLNPLKDVIKSFISKDTSSSIVVPSRCISLRYILDEFKQSLNNKPFCKLSLLIDYIKSFIKPILDNDTYHDEREEALTIIQHWAKLGIIIMFDTIKNNEFNEDVYIILDSLWLKDCLSGLIAPTHNLLNSVTSERSHDEKTMMDLFGGTTNHDYTNGFVRWALIERIILNSSKNLKDLSLSSDKNSIREVFDVLRDILQKLNIIIPLNSSYNNETSTTSRNPSNNNLDYSYDISDSVTKKLTYDSIPYRNNKSEIILDDNSTIIYLVPNLLQEDMNANILIPSYPKSGCIQLERRFFFPNRFYPSHLIPTILAKVYQDDRLNDSNKDINNFHSNKQEFLGNCWRTTFGKELEHMTISVYLITPDRTSNDDAITNNDSNYSTVQAIYTNVPYIRIVCSGHILLLTSVVRLINRYCQIIATVLETFPGLEYSDATICPICLMKQYHPNDCGIVRFDHVKHRIDQDIIDSNRDSEVDSRIDFNLDSNISSSKENFYIDVLSDNHNHDLKPDNEVNSNNSSNNNMLLNYVDTNIELINETIDSELLNDSIDENENIEYFYCTKSNCLISEYFINDFDESNNQKKDIDIQKLLVNDLLNHNTSYYNQNLTEEILSSNIVLVYVVNIDNHKSSNTIIKGYIESSTCGYITEHDNKYEVITSIKSELLHKNCIYVVSVSKSNYLLASCKYIYSSNELPTQNQIGSLLVLSLLSSIDIKIEHSNRITMTILPDSYIPKSTSNILYKVICLVSNIPDITGLLPDIGQSIRILSYITNNDKIILIYGRIIRKITSDKTNDFYNIYIVSTKSSNTQYMKGSPVFYNSNVVIGVILDVDYRTKLDNICYIGIPKNKTNSFMS